MLNAKFPDGKTAYYYIQTTSSKKIALEAQLAAQEEIDLDDYGVVVASGNGEPDQYTIIQMMEKYGAEEH